MKSQALNLALRPLVAALIAGGCLTITPLSVSAADVSWVGGTGSSWIVPSNWNPGLPAAADNVWISLSGAAVSFDSVAGLTYGQLELGATGSAAVLNQAANNLTVAGLLAGRNSGESGIFNLSGGTFTAGAIAGGANPGGVLLGLHGNATFNHSNGTANIEGIVIAEQGGNATYSFADGVLNTHRVYVGGFQGSGGSALFSQTGGTHNNDQFIAIGRDSTREALYHMQGGTLNSAGMVIGYVYDAGNPGGLGRFEQSGGTHVANDLVLGRDAGATGTYNLSGIGSVLTVSGNELVGNAGRGTFNQLAGAHTVNGSLYVDAFAASKGEFNLHGGTLDVAGNTYVGNNALASGRFNHDGGSHTVVNSLVLGNVADATGYYTLSGTGSLLVKGSTVIGEAGTGSFTQDGGSFEQRGDYGALVLGAASGGVGTYTLNAGVLNMQGNEEFIGNAGKGTFYQNGGEHRFSGAMYIGTSAGGDGEYHMAGGAITNAKVDGGNPLYGGIVLGEWSDTVSGKFTVGKFFHSAGTVTVDNVTLARQTGSTGRYEMSEPNSDKPSVLNTNWMNIGQRGTGSFVQYAGSVTVDNDINIGGEPGIIGTYDLHGGTLQTQQLRIGNGGTGTFTQTGGDVNVFTIGGFSILVMAENVGSRGTYNLSGGMLRAEMVFVGDSDQATFNHSGTGTHNVGDLALGIYKNVGEHGQGTYNLSGGTLNSGFVRVGNEGTGTFTQTGGDHNSGGIVVGNVAGSVGTYNLQDGTLNAVGSAIVVGQDGQGTLNISGGHLIADFLRVGAQGMLSGAGGVIEVANLHNAGVVSPGNSPGVMTITGNYSQLDTGVLKSEIEGLASFDQLLVTGDAALNGSLALYRLPGYTPQLGDTFLVLRADSDGDGLGQLNGVFASLQIHGFGSGVSFNPLYDYGLKTVSVQVAAIPEPETWAMLLAGLGLVGWKRRRASDRRHEAYAGSSGIRQDSVMR